MTSHSLCTMSIPVPVRLLVALAHHMPKGATTQHLTRFYRGCWVQLVANKIVKNLGPRRHTDFSVCVCRGWGLEMIYDERCHNHYCLYKNRLRLSITQNSKPSLLREPRLLECINHVLRISMYVRLRRWQLEAFLRLFGYVFGYKTLISLLLDGTFNWF